MNEHIEYHSYPINAHSLKELDVTPAFNYSLPANAREIFHRLKTNSTFSSAEISAIGSLGQAVRQMILYYQKNQNPALLQDLRSFTKGLLYPDRYRTLLVNMLSSFPPESFYLDSNQAKLFLSDRPDVQSYQLELILGLFLVGLVDENPAFTLDRSLFRNMTLSTSDEFQQFFKRIPAFFQSEPRFPKTDNSLLEILRAPWKSSPDSITGQLDYVIQKWKWALDDHLLQSLILSLDIVKEEHRVHGHGPGSAHVPDFQGPSYMVPEDRVNFSEDLDWMPRTVLIAKNVFVWLDQLSRKHMRSITTLDQIPEAEIQLLADSGINSLWLIGLWERSTASQKIKQLCGNPDAIPSAYSLYDYQISKALGGDLAYQNLNDLSRSYGIRLAADMVPNHVGLSSKWIYEHPDWFISLPNSPFPNYSFQGENLSEHSDYSIQIEDNYYNKTDAAVVFKHHQYSSGKTRYIYHGNDGTSMPWNDTAQLNYLREDVREAVIQTILLVARKFSIIRFDAAMTLTKKHFQRLWFPEPGSGGAIPSRAEHGLKKSEFNKSMPTEFWRDVVDRVAEEAPDTLLLAEAFWMMEGFFVRTLGMHRVYNSAFMHMLRDEKNHDYRSLLKKTIEYDPQILKRYVNFMNNPDEETAIAQFGNDGKYFGVCTLMATIPGLPMFGHGQIEGFTEKYGMEYRRAYYNETPDQDLMERHKREIFPLLKKRYLFAEVENFYLYDFSDSSGSISQDVICFSNQFKNEKAFVIYHNKWGDISGTIKKTCEINGVSKALSESLDIPPQPDTFLLYRDHISELEYLIPTETLANTGFHLQMGAYECRVFLDFSIVHDQDGSYSLLHQTIGNQGTSSLEDERRKIKYRGVSNKLMEIFSFYPLSAELCANLEQKLLEKFSSVYNGFLASLIEANQLDISPGELKIITKSAAAAYFNIQKIIFAISEKKQHKDIFSTNSTAASLLWALLNPVKEYVPTNAISKLVPSSLPDLRIFSVPDVTNSNFLDIQNLRSLISTTYSLPSEHISWSIFSILNQIIESEKGKSLLKIHSYQGVKYFHKESFWDLAGLITILKINQGNLITESIEEIHDSMVLELIDIYLALLELASSADFQLEPFLRTARLKLGD